MLLLDEAVGKQLLQLHVLADEEDVDLLVSA